MLYISFHIVHIVLYRFTSLYVVGGGTISKVFCLQLNLPLMPLSHPERKHPNPKSWCGASNSQDCPHHPQRSARDLQLLSLSLSHLLLWLFGVSLELCEQFLLRIRWCHGHWSHCGHCGHCLAGSRTLCVQTVRNPELLVRKITLNYRYFQTLLDMSSCQHTVL